MKQLVWEINQIIYWKASKDFSNTAIIEWYSLNEFGRMVFKK